MRRIIALLGGLLLPALTLAANGTISFQRPTEYADGSVLPPAAITQYEFICTTGTSPGVVCQTLTLPGTATSGVMQITVPGGVASTACVSGRTFVGVAPSLPSNIDCKNFAAVPPGPPQNVTIAVVIGEPVTIAYRYTAAKQRNDFAGFVDVGQPCAGGEVFTYRGRRYFRIDPALVRWEVRRQERVAAPCAIG